MVVISVFSFLDRGSFYRSLRTADAFPVSLLSFHDRKCVCCSQANLSRIHIMFDGFSVWILDRVATLESSAFPLPCRAFVMRKNFRLSISYFCTVVGIALLFLFFSLSFVFNWQFFFLDFDIATLKLEKQSCLVVWRLNCYTCAIRLQT